MKLTQNILDIHHGVYSYRMWAACFNNPNSNETVMLDEVVIYPANKHMVILICNPHVPNLHLIIVYH